jgi:hypothetical protein
MKTCPVCNGEGVITIIVEEDERLHETFQICECQK